jgi:hypothetical protein
MIIPSEINDAFFRGDRSERINYVINDTVEVTQGAYKRREGAIISIKSIEPETCYIVECFDGTGDIVIRQRDLKLLIPSDVGRKST